MSLVLNLLHMLVIIIQDVQLCSDPAGHLLLAAAGEAHSLPPAYTHSALSGIFKKNVSP